MRLTPQQQQLVALQRQAGNRAVANLVAVQRVGGATTRNFASLHQGHRLGGVTAPNPREYLAGGGTQALGDLGDLGGGAAGNVSDYYADTNLIDQDALKAKGDGVYDQSDVDKYRDKPGQTDAEKQKNASDKAGHEATKGKIDIAGSSLGTAAGFVGMYMSIRKMVAEKEGSWDAVSALIASTLGAAAGIAGIVAGADKAGGGDDKGIDLAGKITGVVSGAWGVIKGAVDTIVSGIAAVRSFMRGGKTSQFRNSADAVENLAGTTQSGFGVVKGAYDIAGKGVGMLGKAAPIISIVVNAAHLIRLLVNGIVAAFQKSKMRALKGTHKLQLGASMGIAALKGHYTILLGKLKRSANFINFNRFGKPDLKAAKMTAFFDEVKARDEDKIDKHTTAIADIEAKRRTAQQQKDQKKARVDAIPAEIQAAQAEASQQDVKYAAEKNKQAQQAAAAAAASKDAGKKRRSGIGKFFSTGAAHLKRGATRIGMAVTSKNSKAHTSAEAANLAANQRVAALRGERAQLAQERADLKNAELLAAQQRDEARKKKQGFRGSTTEAEAQKAKLEAEKKRLEAEMVDKDKERQALEESKKPLADQKLKHEQRLQFHPTATAAPAQLTGPAMEKYLLSKELQTIGQKRINRAISQAIPGIIDISGDITTLTGVGGPAGLIQKLVAGGGKLGLSLFRGIKQQIRDWGVGSAKKTTAGKAQRRKDMTVQILKLIDANPQEGKEYLKGTGVDLKTLYTYNHKPNGVKEQAKLIYEALAQRE